jgi:hypothetical protein
MIETYKFEAGGYYLFESLAGSRSCYFESDEELDHFRMLFRRYMLKYVDLHKMHVSSEGYQLLLRVKSKAILKRQYKNECEKKEKKAIQKYLDEPWRIVSEKMRVFHSVYVKAINKMRDREGVLVQKSYKRYYFSEVEQFESYIEKIANQKDIVGQRNNRYRVSKTWVNLVEWAFFQSVEWVESLMSRVFRNYVVSKLVNLTLHLHSPPT